MRWENAQEGQKATIVGKVRRVGNEPFSRLVITDADDHDWNLDKEGQKTLERHEAKSVRVSAVIRIKKQVLANGKTLPDIRELTQVRILD